MFILAPQAKLHHDEIEVPDLEVSDSREDYYLEDCNGIWIREYLLWIALKTGADDGRVDTDNLDSFDFITSSWLRKLAVEFTNEYYECWRDNIMYKPDYDSTCEDCRGYCDDCEHGWMETHGKYDGPLADNVDDDFEKNDPLEDEDDEYVTDAERDERIANQEVHEDDSATGVEIDRRRARNRRRFAERELERARRRAAQEEAECEVVDRKLICDSDCDGFRDHVEEAMLEGCSFNIPWLNRRWSNDSPYPQLPWPVAPAD